MKNAASTLTGSLLGTAGLCGPIALGCGFSGNQSSTLTGPDGNKPKSTIEGRVLGKIVLAQGGPRAAVKVAAVFVAWLQADGSQEEISAPAGMLPCHIDNSPRPVGKFFSHPACEMYNRGRLLPQDSREKKC